MEAIRTEGLTKYYGRARGIIDLDLCVKQGDFFGYIGPNGAGKSTTIRILLGLLRPSGGKAAVLGKDIAEEKMEILKTVGYLPSEAIFYQGMKVREILKFSAGLRKKDCHREAEQLCERMELDVSRKVDELSFGNRKKVAIVCALQHNPELLILDEPTSGLDPLMQREFFRILRERNKAGVTVFLSSHILSEIQRNCTRAAIVRDGRIMACDSVEALVKTSAKRVAVQGDLELYGLPGIRDFKKEGSGCSFLYAGDINDLVRMMAQNHMVDLTVSEPDLEEIFMHYYGKEGDQS